MVIFWSLASSLVKEQKYGIHLAGSPEGFGAYIQSTEGHPEKHEQHHVSILDDNLRSPHDKHTSG